MVLSPKITKEFVMSRVDSYSIYYREVGTVNLKQIINSPLRNDKNPSFSFHVTETGEIKHRDHAYPDDDRFSGDCIDFVVSRYGLTYDKALLKIAKEFGIVDGSSPDEKKVVHEIRPLIDRRRSCFIQVEARKWNKSDMEQWGQFLITTAMCREEEIYPIQRLWVNRGEIPLRSGELVYAYVRNINGQTYFQIYFPQRTKVEGRWLSNTPLTDVKHLENLSKDHNTLVVPSLKCYMVCKQIYPHVCNIKNESMGAVPVEVANQITENSKSVFYGGNNDAPGKIASYKITGTYEWKHLNPPDNLLPQVTDWSDWSKKDQSLKNIEDHFRKKGLFK